ncbi:hypothetical protein GCK32_018905 [Trichostrongylus colubriformis]|uniref:glucuronosyltransferase n=1 Tax=Trichostrongylus colubriformis TaxID=6319 RepID=A0AAN8FD23_TRICO
MKSLLTKFLTLIFLLSRCSNGYKMVIFVPDLTNSQVIFTGRVAETLAKAGHDVTMVLITGFTDRDSSDVEIMKEVSRVTENKEFLDWLVNQKFDLAFPYMADSCPIGLVHYAKIPSWIWLSSAGLIDYAAYYIGAPIVPSYIPSELIRTRFSVEFFEVFNGSINCDAVASTSFRVKCADV